MPIDTTFASVDFYPDATGQNLIPPGGTFTMPLELTLANLTTGAVNILNGYTLGYRFAILGIDAVVGTAGTGTSATQSISMKIGSTAITGGVLTPTLTGTATTGALIAGTAVTALNTGSATDTFSIVAASGGTVFTAGTIQILVRIQNLDS